MEKPTIRSSKPDAMGRTVFVGDEFARQARYGKIRPMREPSGFQRVIARLLPLNS